ncbi:hypothetical protein GOP47_0027453 [Adiantum capillus-veneris]|nr:hypothetical protein GOP47_0027453 [Adiantum capillus-veneris]
MGKHSLESYFYGSKKCHSRDYRRPCNSIFNIRLLPPDKFQQVIGKYAFTGARSLGMLERTMAPAEGNDYYQGMIKEHQKTIHDENGTNPTQFCGKGESYNDYQGLFPRSIRQWGSKDRHSKVLTSRGLLRDRRVRLSVSTAIRFYDVQDKLGFDQPSKAIEWLLDKSQWAFNGLPSQHNVFQSSKRRKSFDVEFCEANENYSNEHCNSSGDDDSLPSIASSITSKQSTKGVTTKKINHIDECNNVGQCNFSSIKHDTLKSQTISGRSNNYLDMSKDGLMFDVSLQGDGNVVPEGHHFAGTNAQEGLIKGIDMEVDEEKRSRAWTDGQIHSSPSKTAAITSLTNACDLQSPVVMINQAYLYCSSPPFVQAGYIINLATDVPSSNLEPVSSSSL